MYVQELVNAFTVTIFYVSFRIHVWVCSTHFKSCWQSFFLCWKCFNESNDRLTWSDLHVCPNKSFMMAGIFRQAASEVTTFNDICLVQTHVMESCMLCHCVIYKLKLSWMCLPSLTSCHVFVVWYNDNGQCEKKTSTCRERQSWCPYMLMFSSHLCNGLYISNDKNRVAQRKWVKTHPGDIKHGSKTCVWTSQ